MSDFNERFYTKDNLKFVSVTTLTGLKSKPALYNFYGKHGTTKARQISEIAKKDGTRVHTWIEHYKDKAPEEELKKGTNEARQAYKNYKAFLKAYKPEMLLEEHTVFYSDVDDSGVEIRYAGTFDGLYLIKGKVVLLDWKTSGGIYEDYRLQAEAYYRALVNEPSYKEIIENNPNLEPVNDLWIIRFDKKEDVDYTLDDETLKKKGIILKIKPDLVRFKAFIGLYYNWLEKEQFKTKKEG